MTSAVRSLIRRPILALAILLITWLGAGSGPLHADSAVRFDIAAPPAASDTTDFHLGTAAGPFGWSSAIADFDEDGLPDFAVADRVADSEGPGYRYRILFSVSGQAPQSIAFESAASQVTVAIEDVDHDHDLDVLVTEVASSNVDAVWLNDGRGRFVESALRPSADSRFARDARSFSPAWSWPDLLAPDGPFDLDGPQGWEAHDATSRAVADASDRPAHSWRFASVSPRAPPNARPLPH